MASAFMRAGDGSLTHAASAGVSELVPLNAVTQLNTVELDGATYLVAAAYGTSSLTVMRVDPDGSLTVTDHVLDSRNTRFQHASQLDVVTVDARVFVAASGSDDGLSLSRWFRVARWFICKASRIRWPWRWPGFRA
ncbi:MAG: hypothetical protein R3D84_06895 [Paracoccaceae bacterium]